MEGSEIQSRTAGLADPAADSHRPDDRVNRSGTPEFLPVRQCRRCPDPAALSRSVLEKDQKTLPQIRDSVPIQPERKGRKRERYRYRKRKLSGQIPAHGSADGLARQPMGR